MQVSFVGRLLALIAGLPFLLMFVLEAIVSHEAHGPGWLGPWSDTVQGVLILVGLALPPAGVLWAFRRR